MESSRNSSFRSRSASLVANGQRSCSRQLGESTVDSVTRHLPLRRCSSLSSQEVTKTAISNSVETQLSTKTTSLGEIVVSFQLQAPSPSSKTKLEDTEQNVDLKIIPAFKNLNVNRRRSYSTSDAMKEEVGCSMDVDYPDNTKRSEVGSDSPKREKWASRTRSYSASDGERRTINGTINESKASTYQNHFFPKSPNPIPTIKALGGVAKSPNRLMKIPAGMVLKSPNGMVMTPKEILNGPNEKMGIQNGIMNSQNAAMKPVPDDTRSVSNNSNGMPKVPHGMASKSPVGLLMVPKGMIERPNVAVKIPNGSIKSPNEFMAIPGVTLKSPDGSTKIGNSSQGMVEMRDVNRKTQHGEMKVQDSLTKTSMTANDLKSQSYQIPCRPKTPKPEQLSHSGTFRRRHVRPPPLQLHDSATHPNSNSEGRAADHQMQHAIQATGNFADSSMKRPSTPRNVAQKNRLWESQQHEQLNSPFSPVRKKFILRVCLEETE